MTDHDKKLLFKAQSLSYRDLQVVQDEGLNKELFWTGDIIEAAVMKQLSSLVMTHRSRSGFVLFGFEPNVDVINAAQDYIDNTLKVEPKSFYHEVRYMIGITKNLSENN